MSELEVNDSDAATTVDDAGPADRSQCAGGDDSKSPTPVAESDTSEVDDENPVDLDSRFLCADGACIGLIGPAGKCKVCGKKIAAEDRAAFEAAMGKAPAPDAPASAVDDGDTPPAASADDEHDGEDGEAVGDADDDDIFDLQERVLCSDGACIGIIGSDGLCRECGTPLTDG